jgi:hypothetical protein
MWSRTLTVANVSTMAAIQGRNAGVFQAYAVKPNHKNNVNST